MKRTFFLAAALLLTAPLAANAGLINGSLTGQVGIGAVPSGWVSNSVSPDTTSSANPAFAFNVNPGDSPDGGTWVGLARDENGFESFGQTVTDFIVGTTYDLSWYATNTGCCGAGFIAPAAILFDLDGTTVFTGSTLTRDGQWHLETTTFVATSTSHTLDFRLEIGARAYLGIDGISLDAVAAAPEPAALSVMGLGLVGLVLVRRRIKA